MNVQKCVWEVHVVNAQSVGEFRPNEVRHRFDVPFPVANDIQNAVILASGTAWIPAQASTMNVLVEIRSASANPNTAPIYSENFVRFGNGGSTHHDFPLKVRPIGTLRAGTYVITIKSSHVETWLDTNDRWEVALIW